jgi:hypothetical protein
MTVKNCGLAGIDPTLEPRSLQDAIRAALATRGGDGFEIVKKHVAGLHAQVSVELRSTF